jgi:hypothetical protein
MDINIAVELERSKMTIASLERENAALRKQVLETGHRASLLAAKCKTCEYHPHPEADRA